MSETTLTPTQKWLLATQSVNSIRSDCFDNQLKLVDYDNSVRVESWRKALERDWDVTNREQVFEESRFSANEGAFRNVSPMRRISPSQYNAIAQQDQSGYFYNDPERLWRCSKNALGHSPAVAFDISRYAFICRMAYTVDLIDEETTWKLLFKISAPAQHYFLNWKEFTLSLVASRMQWLSKSPTRDIIEKNYDYAKDLLANPKAMVNSVAWDTHLQEPGSET